MEVKVKVKVECLTCQKIVKVVPIAWQIKGVACKIASCPDCGGLVNC